MEEEGCGPHPGLGAGCWQGQPSEASSLLLLLDSPEAQGKREQRGQDGFSASGGHTSGSSEILHTHLYQVWILTESSPQMCQKNVIVIAGCVC
jgi:hypothetical protein